MGKQPVRVRFLVHFLVLSGFLLLPGIISPANAQLENCAEPGTHKPTWRDLGGCIASELEPKKDAG